MSTSANIVGGTVTDSACQNNPGWKNKKIFAGCETKTETYTDQIAFATIDADLSPASIRWITTDLAAKYPGAHVYQAHWSLWPGRSPSQGGLAGDGASLSVVYANLPLADPGHLQRADSRPHHGHAVHRAALVRVHVSRSASASVGIDDYQVTALPVRVYG